MSRSWSRNSASGRPSTTTATIAASEDSIAPRSGLLIDLGALLHELDRLLVQALLDVLAHVLGDLHRAEMRPAHRAEVGDLHALLGQRLVVEILRRVRVEPQVELILPAELEARLGHRVVAD